MPEFYRQQRNISGEAMKRATRKTARAIQRRKTRHIQRQAHTTAIVPRPTVAEAIENVLMQGDLLPLTVPQRLEYYKAVCKSLGLNPLTKPFAFISLNGKLVMYALKDCTEQLRKIHGIAIIESSGNKEDDLYVVRVKAQDRSGRTDSGTGVVPIHNLKGLDLANAIMKAETKAKRRATLSMAGLGFLDESELDAVGEYGTLTPNGRVMTVTPAETALSRFEEKEKVQLEQIKQDSSPSLAYTFHAESDTWQIIGSKALKEANWDLLGPLYNGNSKTIVANAQQLGKLISQFEERKVPFRDMNALRQPGE
jgi:hypothetical protein